MATRMANRFVPGLLDRYLGHTGLKSQQTAEPVDLSQWHDNVDSPVDAGEDRGAHGVFDDRAHARSWQLAARTHRGGLAVAGVAATALTVVATVARRRR